MSTVEGLHVPVMPLVEVAGNDGTPWPAQIVRDAPNVNAGATFGFTVTVKVAVVAH